MSDPAPPRANEPDPARMTPSHSASTAAGVDALASRLCWAQDAEFRFTSVSDFALRAAGLRAEAFIGRRRWEVAHEGVSETDWTAHRGALEARREFREFEYAVRGADGAPTWFSVSGEPWFDAAGGFAGYRGIALDITSRKQAEGELRSRSRILEAVRRTIPDALSVTDGETGQVIVNDRFYELFDLDRTAAEAAVNPVDYGMLQMALRGEYGPGDPAALARERRAQVERRLAETGAFSYERQLRSGRWIEARLTPFEGSGWISLYRDITAEKERAAESERRAVLLRTLLGSIGEGISVFDRDLRLVAWNARFGELVGVEAELLAPGTSLRDILLAQARAGEFGVCDFEAEVERRLATLWPAEPLISERTRPDGRTIELRRSPIPEGGFVTVYLDISERKRAERALRDLNASLEAHVIERSAAVVESEARLRAIIEDAPAGIVSTTLDGEIFDANVQFCAILGYSKDELIGKSVDAITHPGDMEATVAVTADIVAGRRKRHLLEKRYLRKDGEVVWVNVHATVMCDARGEDSYRLAVVEDITERKRQAELLANSEVRLRTIVQNAPTGILANTTDGTILEANPRFAAIVGYRIEELIGKSIEELTHPVDWPANRVSLAQAGEGLLGSYTLEKRYLKKDGSTVWAIVHATTVRGAQGGHQFQLAVVEDITDRIAKERALRASEERLRQVIDLVPHHMFAKDADGRYVFSNRAFANAYGLTPEAMVGKTNIDIGMSPQEAALVNAADAEILRSGKRIEIPDQRLRGIDGIERVFWNVRMPFRHSPDAPQGVLAIATDITALKAAHAEVEAMNAELEARVAARTAELSAANRELESFSYSISHDLRAPVRAVTGFSEAMLQSHAGALPADARKLLERVHAAGGRMGAMIEGLLELARLARSSVRRVEVDLGALAREVWEEVLSTAPRRAIEFSAPDRCVAVCDPVLARSALENLLGNALKYTRCTASARVEFGEFAGAEGRVFYVRDNGAGFDMKYADKLFGTFQRLHSEREFEGTGVGLATVKRIVERHGGRVWAQASPGAGASFFFTLGQARADA